MLINDDFVENYQHDVGAKVGARVAKHEFHLHHPDSY